MLNLELRFHAKLGTLLDSKGLLLQSFERTGCPQVDDDVVATFNLETKGEDDTFAGVVGVRDVLALTKTKGCFPLLQRLVVLVWKSMLVHVWQACLSAEREQELLT